MEPWPRTDNFARKLGIEDYGITISDVRDSFQKRTCIRMELTVIILLITKWFRLER